MDSAVNIKDEIIEIAVHLASKNLLAAADGNISYRLKENEVLITPSGRPKRRIKPADIAHIDIENNLISGKPSSESLMHCFIFRHCPEAKAIIHAHPPTAIAWTIAEPELKKLPDDCLSELILATGGIPIAAYARPGTNMMGEVLRSFLPQHRAIILARHGAITWGESLEECCNGMERIEHTAEILWKAASLKQLSALPAAEVAALYEMRAKLGNRLL